MIIHAIFRKAKSAARVVARNGLRHSLHLASIYLIVPVCQGIAPWIGRFYLKLRRWKRRSFARFEVYEWRRRLIKRTVTFEEDGCARLESLRLRPDQATELRQELLLSPEVELGPIDQDGFLLSRFDSLTVIPNIERENFLPRKRFDLSLVALRNGLIGIRKCFRGDRVSFLNELEVLYELAKGSCNVPRILDVDFDRLTIVMSFIPGPVLREQLVKKGARIRDRDLDQDPALDALSREQLQSKRIEEVRKVLGEVIDANFVERLFRLIQSVHSRGIILFDIKYGNVIVEPGSGLPFLIDFDHAIKLRNSPAWLCRALRDRDIEKFNLYFNTDKLTYARLKRGLRTSETPLSSFTYSPVYFGAGLKTKGPLWGNSGGYGRWKYLLESNLPVYAGSRVLDLGTNNGIYAIELLRRGAKEVIGVELDETRVAQAEFLRSAFEWADNRNYEFRIIQANMAQVVSMKLGQFEVVLALCSIYYLEDEDIFRLVRHLSSIAKSFVWQCNLKQDIYRKDKHVFEKASIEYAVAALEQNGFPVTRVVAPRAYLRPLVIGSKT